MNPNRYKEILAELEHCHEQLGLYIAQWKQDDHKPPGNLTYATNCVFRLEWGLNELKAAQTGSCGASQPPLSEAEQYEEIECLICRGSGYYGSTEDIERGGMLEKECRCCKGTGKLYRRKEQSPTSVEGEK